MGMFLRDQPPLAYGGRRPPYQKATKRPKIFRFHMFFDQLNIKKNLINYNIEMMLLVVDHEYD